MRIWPIILFASFLVVGLTRSNYEIDLMTTALTFGLFAASVDLSWGYCGILNLGSALYFDLGAYAAAYALKSGWGFSSGLLLGMSLSVVLAGMIGYIGFRTKASVVQYGLIGLITSLTIQQLVIELYSVTGGDNGITNVPHPTPLPYFILVYFIVGFVMLALIKLTTSPLGKVMISLREDEEKTESFGYNSMSIKFWISILTAATSAVAGALYVPVIGIAEPSLFGIIPNMLVLVWVALGGQGTLVGPFFCAIGLKLIESELGSNFQNVYILIVGAIFVCTVMLWPNGIMGAFRVSRFDKKSTP